MKNMCFILCSQVNLSKHNFYPLFGIRLKQFFFFFIIDIHKTDLVHFHIMFKYSQSSLETISHVKILTEEKILSYVKIFPNLSTVSLFNKLS